MRARVLAVLVAAATLAVPAAASAAVRCVGTAGGDCTATYANTADALTAAVDGVDTVRFGPGTFDPIDTTKVLTFVGAGAGTPDSTLGATVILQSTSSESAINLRNGGTIRSLRAQGGPSSGMNSAGGGVQWEPAGAGPMTLNVIDVIATGGPTAPPAVPGGAGLSVGASNPAGKVVTVTGGAFFASSSPTGGGFGAYTCCVETHLANTVIRTPSGPGLYASIGARTTLDGVTVEGTDAIQTQAPDSLTVTRSRVAGVSTGFNLRSDLSGPTTVTVRDSLVTASPSDGHAAVWLLGDMGQPVIFNAIGSTFIGRGASLAAIYAQRNADGSAGLNVMLRNSIARAEGAAASDLWADRSPIGADFSSFNTRKLENGGTAPEPGSASNVAGDPLLAPDFSLQPGSPLIDRGDPSVLLPGELDLAGAARSLDGTGDCVAAPDIGAFERPDICPPPPNVPPELTNVSATNRVFAPVALRARPRAAAHRRRVKRGTRFRYTLSEPARVRIRIERAVRRRGRTRYRKVTVLVADKQAGRQSTRFTGRVRRRAVKPGRYRARLVATDAGGLKSGERRLKLRIVRP